MPSDLLEQQATASRLRQLARDDILSAPAFERALGIAGILPSKQDWHVFIKRMLLVLGITFLLAGIIFFFAYNWANLGRFFKFGLLEAAILLSVALAWHQGLEGLSGKMALLTAAVLPGPLLAVYGQTYQTGADPYGLFLSWAMFILGWALIGQFSALWFLFILLLNLSLTLYWTQILDSTVWTFAGLCDAVFLLNSAALILWEAFAVAHIAWMRGRWLPRLLLCVSTVCVLMSTFECIFDFSDDPFVLSAPALCVIFIATGLWFYQNRVHDLFMLVVILLGAMVTLTSLVIKIIGMEFYLTFFYGLFVIAQTVVAVYWLRRIQERWEAAA